MKVVLGVISERGGKDRVEVDVRDADAFQIGQLLRRLAQFSTKKFSRDGALSQDRVEVASCPT